jgi:hypothetical protein
MITYKFGTLTETPNGKKWSHTFTRRCDSDAQAELEARNHCQKNRLDGLYIRRGDVEWYCRGRS